MYIISDIGLENLSNAIIIRAVEDYEKALVNDDKLKIQSIERFLNSEWYNVLSNLDGQYIIDEMKRRYYSKHQKT